METEKNNDVMQVYISKKLNKALTDYIIENDLDLERITVNKQMATILNNWVKEPKLDEGKIFKPRIKDGNGENSRRINVSILKETAISINRLYMQKYIYSCSSRNGLALNVVEQWATSNILDYSN